MSDRPLRVILDTSAILRFARGDEASVGVGETIAEVNDEQAGFGLPLLCLAEAWRVAGTDAADLFEILAGHEAAVWLQAPEDWRAFATATDIAGRADAAAAVLLAIDNGAHLLTATPALYAGFAGAAFVIEV